MPSLGKDSGTLFFIALTGRCNGALSSRAFRQQSAENLSKPCGHERGGSIYAIKHTSVWKSSPAFSIQSFEAGLPITGNSIPLRCGRSTGTQTIRSVPGSCENTDGYVDVRYGLACCCKESQRRTRPYSPTGALAALARLSDGSGVRRETPAPFCERPEVQSL